MSQLWKGWKRVARVIGNFQARVVLSLVYAVLVTPLGLLVRLLGDPLRLRARGADRESYFVARENLLPVLDEARRQF